MSDRHFSGWHPDPETFLAALRPWGLKQTGKDEYRARCPAHDGGDPNLAIRQDGDKVLAHCHSHGCNFEGIWRALGLERNPPRAGERRRKPDDRFEYRDPSDRVLVTVCRRDLPDGKKIWREPKGAKPPPGGWPLYRLLSLLADPGSSILLVEGEKTADAAQGLLEREFQVTTTIGGDWREGRYIPTSPSSGAGRSRFGRTRTSRGESMAMSLRAYATRPALRTCGVVETTGLPRGWDLADPEPLSFDILKRLDSAESFVRRSQPVNGGNGKRNDFVSIGNFMLEADPTINWLVDGMVPGGGTALIVGAPKTGKSTIGRNLVLAVALRT